MLLCSHSPPWAGVGPGIDQGLGLPISEGPVHCFVRRQGRWRPESHIKLRNSLLAAVGYIETANARDFTANVCNMLPLPIHAIVLMAIGGTVALAMLYFVTKDAVLSWRNLRGLRAEPL
ncbi:hypothetical protein B0T24DRAFT_722585 [Lasiosphaeria ovina]|uniref:Uncharacterized protein n=1 Tax=Lasiosphaeria ovina TaxID=92902 RepID=A0AAE0N4C2_9PEZI|nr:hypothetical protein B0T24DRAFT_722585 [Lasiosphaeria ovina]